MRDKMCFLSRRYTDDDCCSLSSFFSHYYYSRIFSIDSVRQFSSADKEADDLTSMLVK